MPATISVTRTTILIKEARIVLNWALRRNE